MKSSLRLRYFFVALASAFALSTSLNRACAAFAVSALDSPEVVVPKNQPLPLPTAAGTRAHLYRMNYWLSGAFIVAGSAANIYAINKLIKAKDPLTDAELAAVNPGALPAFDRWILDHRPDDIDRPDKISDYILNGAIISGVFLGFDKAIRKDALRLAMLYAETQVVTFTLYDFSPFGPGLQNKYRPVVYFNDIPEDVRRDGNNRNSFYGGHVANAAAATFCAAKIYSDYHPELGRKKYLLFGAAAIPPLVMSYFRTRALKHFPSDNLVGLLIGATCGIVVPELHRFKSQRIKIHPVGTPAGPGLSVVYKPR